MWHGEQVEVAVAAAAQLGESPMWHPREQVLYYCDIAGRKLQRFDPSRSQLQHWEFDTEPASLAPRVDGSLLLAMRDGLWVFDPANGTRTLAVRAPYDTALERYNDGKA